MLAVHIFVALRTLSTSSVRSLRFVVKVYKSTGDYEGAKKMYDHYSDVNDRDAPHMLSLRATVLDRKQPRKMFVQCNTMLNGTSTCV